MQKTDWNIVEIDDRLVVSRVETPLGLWLLDRWFRIPDAMFDWIGWRVPRTSRLTRLPCLMYARWFPELVVRQTSTDFVVTQPAPEDGVVGEGTPP